MAIRQMYRKLIDKKITKNLTLGVIVGRIFVLERYCEYAYIEREYHNG
jgi:hypothetical protein